MKNNTKHKFLINFYIKNHTIINMCIIFLCFCINMFWQDMKYITYSILSLMILLDNDDHNILYLAFTIPFCNIEGNKTLLLFSIPISIYIVKVLIKLIKEKTKINWKFLIPVCLMLIYAVLPIGQYNQSKWLKIISLVIICVVVLLITIKPELLNLSYFGRTIACSIILSCALSLTYKFSPYLQAVQQLDLEVSFLRYQSLMSHTNLFSIICQLTLAILLSTIFQNKAKWFDYTLFVVVACLGLLTFSKTYLIILTILLVSLLIYFLRKHKKQTLLASGIILLVITIACCVFHRYISIMFNRFFGFRSSCSTFEDFMNMITTERYDLWIEYLRAIGNNPKILFFGNGLGSSAISSLSAHNAFISLVYMIGLVGCGLFISSLICIITLNKGKNRFLKSYLIILVVICLILLVEDTLFYMPNV